jgi:hypothetical protein
MTDDVSALFRQVAANMTAVADGEYPQAVSKAIDLVSETFAAGQNCSCSGTAVHPPMRSISPLNSSGGLSPSAGPFPPSR